MNLLKYALRKNCSLLSRYAPLFFLVVISSSHAFSNANCSVGHADGHHATPIIEDVAEISAAYNEFGAVTHANIGVLKPRHHLINLDCEMVCALGGHCCMNGLVDDNSSASPRSVLERKNSLFQSDPYFFHFIDRLYRPPA